MKSLIRTMVVGGLAMLAFSAVAVASASAATPEFKLSTKQAFTGTSGAVKWEDDEIALTCTKETSKGEVTGATTLGNVVLTFTGCGGEAHGVKCKIKSTGAKTEGEIVTSALTGYLGEVNKTEAASGVGLMLEASAAPHRLATFEGCNMNAEMDGGVAAEVTPTKTAGKTLQLAFIGAKGANDIKSIEVAEVGKHPSLKMNLTGWSLDLTETLSFEKTLEVT